MIAGGSGEWPGGPLAPLADDLRRELAGRGYTPRTAGDQLRLAAGLSRWLEGRGLTADGVTALVVEEFFQLRRTQGQRRWLTSRSVSALLACLQIERCGTSIAGAAPSAALQAAYRDYLLAERGLTAGTVAQYLRYATVFLSWLPAPAEAGLAGLSAGQVTAFIMAPGKPQVTASAVSSEAVQGEAQ